MTLLDSWMHRDTGALTLTPSVRSASTGAWLRPGVGSSATRSCARFAGRHWRDSRPSLTGEMRNENGGWNRVDATLGFAPPISTARPTLPFSFLTSPCEAVIRSQLDGGRR